MIDTKVIVLTGGPCSGKTSAKAVLMQKLIELGITPIFIPESATLLLGSGMNISGTLSDPVKAARFQELVLSYQLASEDVFLELSQLHEKAVLICDRGAIDGGAYVEWESFLHMASDMGLSLGALMSRYDGVIHLVTAADGAAQYYNMDNPARYESLEDAVAVDKRLQAVWSGHPCLRIVPNVTWDNEPMDFGRKLDYMVQEMCSILGLPVPIESERKFLVKMPPWIPKNARLIHIVQTYLERHAPDTERRVRVWQYGAEDALYFYTEKRSRGTGGRERFEVERQISASEYITLLSDRDYNLRDIRKQRYCYTIDNQYYEQDVISSPMNICLLEVQASELNEKIRLPDYFNVINEVTDDPLYKNASIAAGTCPGYP